MSENRSMQYAEILSKLIQVETISSRDNKDITKFLGFHKPPAARISSQMICPTLFK